MNTTGPAITDILPQLKPLARGWLHAVMAPAVLVAGLVLVLLAEPGAPRVSTSVYTAAGLLLFGTSGLYHRGTWGPAAHRLLKRLDHGNVYLLIAGTYTPEVALGLTGTTRTAFLIGVWVAAAIGLGFRWLWPEAPRALYTALYIVLGWSIAPLLGQLIGRAGVAVVVLTLVGGVMYTLGAVVYALRRPDPSPRCFGFHEVFHACTIAAWVCQYIAIFLLLP